MPLKNLGGGRGHLHNVTYSKLKNNCLTAKLLPNSVA